MIYVLKLFVNCLDIFYEKGPNFIKHLFYLFELFDPWQEIVDTPGMGMGGGIEHRNETTGNLSVMVASCVVGLYNYLSNHLNHHSFVFVCV